MKIVFVCTGNICRSPMGEALTRHLLAERGVEGVEVSSCGTWGLTGQAATAHAVSVLADLGVDAATHRARELEVSEIAAADLVIAMTSVHLREIERAVPRCGQKIRLLKEIAELEPAETGPGASAQERLDALLAAPRPRWRRDLDLDDPMGLPRGVYQRCADQVHAGVRALIDHLFPVPGP